MYSIRDFIFSLKSAVRLLSSELR